MFIATSARPRVLAALGAKPGSRKFAEAGKTVCTPTELSEERKYLQAINVPRPLGRSDKQCPVALPT